MNSHRMILATALVAMLVGCTSSTTPPRIQGKEVRIQYAEVLAVSRERLPSAAPAGAVVGGFTGLMLSRRSSGAKQVASGVGGAVLGGLATRALEGERLGYSYRLRYLDGAESAFITEKGYLMVGDCVAVESGEHQNLRRVSRTVCETQPLVRTPAAAMHQNNAEQCHAAKQQLLIAQGKERIDDAARKVEIICHF